jgi:HD-GYP domain-containing protein (c-di-GMP phosphodiesterase class II)
LDDDGRVIAFAKEYERVLFSIASQAAICLTNRKYAADVVGLLDSFVFAMSAAVDARSPYTANHSRNMEKYAKRFIAWINESGKGVFFSPEKEREFLMSILLHDIGKLVVPTKVMDKNSRLCTKLGEILSRFQAFHMQAEINHLRGLTDYESYKKQITEIENAQELIEKANNIGFIDDEMMEELRALGSKTAIGPNGEEFFITPEEQTGLTVRKGTLTDAERAIIESHASMTNRILSEVRFPKNYRMVAEWASSHHEHLNGGGYPNKLAGDEISTEVRILTIIDVYEALTAHDRPYKPAMPAQRAFAILDDMAAQGQVDAELLAMFKESGAWEI